MAIAAGCDALLGCSSEENQERAAEALTREAEVSPSFRARCEEALARILQATSRVSARPQDDAAIARAIDGTESRAVAAEIDRPLDR